MIKHKNDDTGRKLRDEISQTDRNDTLINAKIKLEAAPANTAFVS